MSICGKSKKAEDRRGREPCRISLCYGRLAVLAKMTAAAVPFGPSLGAPEKTSLAPAAARGVAGGGGPNTRAGEQRLGHHLIRLCGLAHSQRDEGEGNAAWERPYQRYDLADGTRRVWTGLSSKGSTGGRILPVQVHMWMKPLEG